MVVVCGHCLVTLSITSYWNIKMALIAAHLNAEVILVTVVCSDRYIIFSPHLHTPSPPPLPLSLISRTVSVDVKHHVYLLWFLSKVPGEIKRSRDLRGGRWSWTFKFALKRWVGRWSWAEQVGRLLLRVVHVVHKQRCNGHCLSDSVQHSSWNSSCAVHKSLGRGR